jgi:hypothetical protein
MGACGRPEKLRRNGNASFGKMYEIRIKSVEKDFG